jgi:ATP-dependent DNA helicase RecG
MPDLVSYFPRAYEDRTQFKMSSELSIGETVCVRAMVAVTPKLSRIRKGLDLVKFHVVDDFGSVDITFFNQAFIKDVIKQGETYVFYGKVEGSPMRLAMTNPLFEEETSAGKITGRIMPIYSLTGGLSQKIIAGAVRSALDKCADSLPDVLPESVVKEFELCRARFAYENIHFPEDIKALEIARKRLIFEELFVLVAAMRFLRLKRVKETGRALEMPDFDEFYKAFRFTPTNAQKRAIEEAAKDMNAQRPMSRLIQGDVGSGKTLVAAACCWMTWKSGCQSAFMAPTEILAKQHHRSLTELLEPLGMRIGLLTGSMTPKRKADIYNELKSGGIDLIIGTHALISEGVEFCNLALVITDEQHRFGVNQRTLLSEKGDSPHVLVMSATPIPRTLALIIYGDLDVSIIDEMPPGRQKIETYVVGEQMRKRIYAFVEKLVGEGRQVYIICPMVEENVDLDERLKSVKDYFETLSNEVFPELRVELVHGKMSSKKKDAAMNAFASGEADILVATTVVEVGVDVPNAALIVIENADRFGLSQLHQLRGRIGRGEHESFCILFNSSAGVVSRERLEVMRATNDGFKIAEEDLKIRGPGDFFGSRQHGLPELRIANFVTDMQVLHQAQNAVSQLLDLDPELATSENRKLSREIARMFGVKFGLN